MGLHEICSSVLLTRREVKMAGYWQSSSSSFFFFFCIFMDGDEQTISTYSHMVHELITEVE